MCSRRAPGWMRYCLWAAAAYNIAWGAIVIAFPSRLFSAAGMQPPVYPEIVQCLGMVVGVYGLAYAIAANDPIRHWPIVLTGLVGKILGPIGFLRAAEAGRLPWAMGWTIVTNDLIWWIPFGLMVWGAYQSYVERQRAIAPEVVRFALRTRTSDGTTLDCLSRKSPVLLVFLRHLGCTFCRQALDDLARQRARIEGMGTSIVLVHMEAERHAVKYLTRQRLGDLPHITDPCQHLYRAFGLKRGTVAELFGPKAILRGLQLLPKYGAGRMLGDGWQMPGAFLLYQGEVIRSYRHKSIADRPAYTAMVNGAEALAPGMHIQ